MLMGLLCWVVLSASGRDNRVGDHLNASTVAPTPSRSKGRALIIACVRRCTPDFAVDTSALDYVAP